jgi:cytochrome P450
MTASFIEKGLSGGDLTAEAIVQILAGADSSATAIRTSLLYIISRPSICLTLQAEIDRGVKEGRISSPVIQDSEALKMPYLQAVICEGLRIWPPVTGLLNKWPLQVVMKW